MKPYWLRDPSKYSKCNFGNCNRTALASCGICEFHEKIGRVEHYGKYKGDQMEFRNSSK